MAKSSRTTRAGDVKSTSPSSVGLERGRTADVEEVGTTIGTIKVELDPQLLRLFAVGLYRSPNKAVEELVTNSFDALARRVVVQLPSSESSADPTIWVADDGEGMNREGLRHLWMIGRSHKRDTVGRARPPIGKFGIGKLATFVLGRRLTYVSKSAEGYLAVTMDFERASESSADADRHTRDIPLNLRRLTEDEAKSALEDLDGIAANDSPVLLPLFGEHAAETWTVAAIRGLHPMGEAVTVNRLRWVLSTALPLGGAFRVWLDGQLVSAERLHVSPVKTWSFGVQDSAAEKMGLSIDPKTPGVVIPGIPGIIAGTMAVYDGPLTRGKSSALGRSNGFFVRVRGRVINLEDALFGMEPLSHTTFAAFRMEVEADGLDLFLRSSRESVEERKEVERLRAYLRAKFSEARTFYEDWLSKREFESLLSTRIDRTPSSLSRLPLLEAIRDVVGGEAALYLTRVPSLSSGIERDDFLKSLDASSAASGLFSHVRLDPTGWDRPIAEYDAQSRTLTVNELHPFYANYASQFRSIEPFELLATTEVLTEAYLREAGVSPDIARDTLMRRDRFLRALVLSQQPTVPLVVQMLNEKQLDDDVMRLALQNTFSCLGFEVTRLSGRTSPNALAAVWGGREGGYAVALYAVTTDTWANTLRSTSSGRVSKQLKKYRAEYALLLIPDTPPRASGSATAADLEQIRSQARAQGVLVVTVSQLLRVLLAAATRGVSLEAMEVLFSNTGTSPVEEWLSSVAESPLAKVPIRDLLDLTWDIQQSRRERVQVGMIVERARSGPIHKLKTTEVMELFRSLRRFAGPSISVDGLYVTLEAAPDVILTNLVTNLNSLPESIEAIDSFVIRKKDLPLPQLALG